MGILESIVTSQKLENGKKVQKNNWNFAPVPSTHLQQILYTYYSSSSRRDIIWGLVTNADSQVPPETNESISAF